MCFSETCKASGRAPIRMCVQVTCTEPDILVGRLFDRPTTTCPCGSRVLEMLYCEPCGDIFLGGYRRELRPGVWSLVPDDPNIEKAPDHSASDRTYANYAVYWPARTATAPHCKTRRRTLDPGRRAPRQWRPASIRSPDRRDPDRSARQDATGWLYYVPQLHQVPVPAAASAPSAQNDRPSVCPQCEANWSELTTAAPIRTQRTGFQKIAQVLTDALLREIAPSSPRRTASGRRSAAQAGPVLRQPPGRCETRGRRREVALARRHAPRPRRRRWRKRPAPSWHSNAGPRGRPAAGRSGACRPVRTARPDAAVAIMARSKGSGSDAVGRRRNDPAAARGSDLGSGPQRRVSDSVASKLRPSAAARDRDESGRRRPKRDVDGS